MLWQMQSAHFSVRCFSLDVAGRLPCIVNVTCHQKSTHQMWISRGEYDKSGSTISHRIPMEWTSWNLRPHTFVVHTGSDGNSQLDVVRVFCYYVFRLGSPWHIGQPRQHRLWLQWRADVKRFRVCVHGDKSLSGLNSSTEWWTFPLCDRDVTSTVRVSVSCGDDTRRGDS